MNKKVAKCMTPGSHGSTFGGNPLAMSVGNAVLDIILKKGFLKNVQKTSIYFHNELKRLHSKYPTVIREIRGVGLLVGIQIYKNQIEFIKKLFDRGLLTVKASENVVRLLPPLTVKKKNIDEAVEILEKVCKTYK